MLESKISVSAAANLGGVRKVITMIDLDGTALFIVDPINGGSTFNRERFIMNNKPALDLMIIYLNKRYI